MNFNLKLIMTADKIEKANNSSNNNKSDDDLSSTGVGGGYFRGAAAASGRAKMIIRAVGSQRALAFASEGAVAGKTIMPKWMFYSAWGISGAAICADITTRTWDAPKNKEKETALYWTLFHIPASLVIPAVIIHKVVHTVEQAMMLPTISEKVVKATTTTTAATTSSTASSSSSLKPSLSKSSSFFLSSVQRIPLRFRPFVPVGAALLSIIPVVPAVDYTAELILEPTLGSYLGLEFKHHH